MGVPRLVCILVLGKLASNKLFLCFEWPHSDPIPDTFVRNLATWATKFKINA